MNNEQALQQAAEKEFPMMSEIEFNNSDLGAYTENEPPYRYEQYQIDVNCDRAAFIAGANWLSSQQEGGEKVYRWVKASERLPQYEEMISCKDNLGYPRLGNFFEDTDGRNCFAVIGTEMYAPFTISENNFRNLFWLEEVTTPVPAALKGAEEAGKYFDNNSDCYADTWHSNGIGAEMTQGEVTPAMTKTAFLKYASQFKSLSAPAQGGGIVGWVKASDRLPVIERKFAGDLLHKQIAIKAQGLIFACWYEDEYKHFKLGNSDNDICYNKSHFEKYNIYWLDESPLAQSVQDAGEEKKDSSKWISVKDDLPKEYGRYWCYVEEVHELGKSHFQWNCSFNPQTKRFTDTAIIKGEQITHWQPLPSPPSKPK